MKTRLFIPLAALFILLASCEKQPVKLDPMAPVYFNGREVVYDAKGQELLSVKEVIKEANRFITLWDNSEWIYTIDGVCKRDTVNNRIVGYSSWVITDIGELETELIEARNILLVYIDYNPNGGANGGINYIDTLGYIPNSVMVKAEADIHAAYQAQDYEECYRLFEEAFIFYPVTGAGYLELAAEGLN